MSTLHKKDLYRLLFLALISVTFLSPALLTSRILFPGDLMANYIPWNTLLPPVEPNNRIISDILEQTYPYYHLFRSEVLEGRLPLWNPYTSNGTPFLATGVSALFSPLRWLLLLFPTHQYLEISALIKLLVAGSGFYFLCRRLRLSRDSALLAGFVYALGGYNIFYLGFINTGATMLLGWGLFALETFLATGSRKHLVGWSVILGASYLSGHMEAALLQHLAYGLYALVRRPKRLAWVILFSLLSVSLAGVALLPFTEFVFESANYSERIQSTRNPFFLPAAHWFNLIIPHHLGSMDATLGLTRFSIGSLSYVGVVPLFLALVGLFSPLAKTLRRPAVALAAWSLSILWGLPGFFDLFTAFSVLKVGNHLHIASILLGAIAILAAVGATALSEGQAEKTITKALFLVLLLILAAYLVSQILEMANDGISFFFVRWQVGFPAYGIWTIVTLAAVWIFRGSAFARPIFVGVVVLNAFLFGFFFNTVAKPQYSIDLVPPLVEELSRHPHDRMVALGNAAMPPNSTLPWKIRDFRGYESVRLGRYDRFARAFVENPNDVHFFVQFLDFRRLATLRRSGCGFLLTPERLDLPGLEMILDEFPFLYRISQGRRAEIVSGAVPVSSPEDALTHLLDSPDGAFLAIEQVLPTSLSSHPGRVDWITDLPNRVELEVEVEQPAWLVLRDSYQDDWQADVDGQATQIFAADFLFRAVRIPAGHHRVRFSYRPWSFRWGGIISLGALLAVVGLLVAFRSRSPHDEEDEEHGKKSHPRGIQESESQPTRETAPD